LPLLAGACFFVLQVDPFGLTGPQEQDVPEPPAAQGSASSGSAGADAGPAGAAESVPDELLVRYRPGVEGKERAETRAAVGATLERTMPEPALELVELAGSTPMEAAMNELEADPDVLYAEPNYLRSASAVPDDELFGTLWALENGGQLVAGRAGPSDADIDASEAWDVVTGESGVTVAVVDSGVAYDHPDLAANVWANARESSGSPGVDDDGNGRVDDVRGWDFVDRDNDPSDANGHGTHVAGTIGARGNDGRGVSGVSWRVSLLPVRVLRPDGSGSVSDAIAGYWYAVRAGARVINVSLGGSGLSRAEADAIAGARDTLFVVAAGNDGTDNDAVPKYPCNHPAANIVCVAATGRDDALAGFSNFGAASVDLAAPGEDIVSTHSDGGYAIRTGTSMAAPHVAGVAALLFARLPGASVAEVKGRLLGGVDPRTSLGGRTVTGGRLNAFGALSSSAPGRPPAESQPVSSPGIVPLPSLLPGQPPSPPAPPAPPPVPASPSTVPARPAPVPSPPPAAPAATPSPAQAPAQTPGPASSGPGPAPPAGQPAPAAREGGGGRSPALGEPIVRDRTPPQVRLTLVRRQRLATLLGKGLPLVVRCSERCTIAPQLRVQGRAGVTLGLRRLAEAGQSKVTLTVSGAARTTLRRAGRGRLFLSLRVADRAGNSRTFMRTVEVRG